MASWCARLSRIVVVPALLLRYNQGRQMAIPLLRTKFYVPPVRSNLVPRQHLIERLDEGLRLGYRLTLVSAPAGFGKTTQLGEWASQQVSESAVCGLALAG